MSDFRSVPLEACLDTLIDYRGKSPPKSREGIPVISAKVVKSGRILRPIEQKIAPDFYPIWMTRGLPMPGDIIMTTEGPLGEVAQLDHETSGYALGQRIVLLRGRPGILDNTFLKYLLQSPRQQQIISSFATGTTVEGISQKSLRNLPLTLPAFSTQLAIADVLGALDEKIYLNRQMNETLEAMAQAFFKDWFVDFGPTWAKMERRKPYLAPALWCLFPETIDNEEKPLGWEWVKAGEIIAFNPAERIPGGTLSPYLDMAALPTVGSWPDEPVTRVYASGSRFRNGDALLARITPCLENGKAAFIQRLQDNVIAGGSTEFIVMRAQPPLPSAFSYLLARYSEFKEHAIRSMTGTSGRQRVQVDSLAAFPVVKPAKPVAEAFGDLVEPWFAGIACNARESETLAALRDLLLPKLIAGEIRVKEAEKIMAEVA